MAKNVFDHHDGAIDEHAEVQRPEREEVGGDVAEVKANGRKEQRERHRQRNDDGATNIAEKQEEDDDDEEDAFAQVVQDGVRGVVDQVAAVQVGNDLDALGKDLLVQLLNLLVNSIEGGIFVGAFEQEDDAADDV